MKKQVVLLILFLCIGLWSLIPMLSCGRFPDAMHFSSFDLSLRLTESIHNDTETPLVLVRVFHNKVTGVVLDTFQAYLNFWNVLFLASFLSVAGMIGFLTQWYAFFVAKKRSLVFWVLFSVVLLSPFLEIFGYEKMPFIARFTILAGSFILWSLLGYWYLLKQKRMGWWLGLLLLFVSMWYLFGLPQFLSFCAQ